MYIILVYLSNIKRIGRYFKLQIWYQQYVFLINLEFSIIKVINKKFTMFKLDKAMYNYVFFFFTFFF